MTPGPIRGEGSSGHFLDGRQHDARRVPTGALPRRSLGDGLAQSRQGRPNPARSDASWASAHVGYDYGSGV